MGRRPKGLPKDISLGINRLTEKQGDLLAWVYHAGYIDASRSEVVWSAKAYLGRSPTQSEAATLTKRMQTLELHELVRRSERLVMLTEEGRWLLYAYAVEPPKNWAKQRLIASLERDKATRELEAYNDFLIATAQHCAGDSEKMTAIHEVIKPVAQSIRERQHTAIFKLEAINRIDHIRQDLINK